MHVYRRLFPHHVPYLPSRFSKLSHQASKASCSLQFGTASAAVRAVARVRSAAPENFSVFLLHIPLNPLNTNTPKRWIFFAIFCVSTTFRLTQILHKFFWRNFCILGIFRHVLYIGHCWVAAHMKNLPVLYIGHSLSDYPTNVLYIGQVRVLWVNNVLYIGQVRILQVDNVLYIRTGPIYIILQASYNLFIGHILFPVYTIRE